MSEYAVFWLATPLVSSSSGNSPMRREKRERRSLSAPPVFPVFALCGEFVASSESPFPPEFSPKKGGLDARQESAS